MGICSSFCTDTSREDSKEQGFHNSNRNPNTKGLTAPLLDGNQSPPSSSSPSSITSSNRSSRPSSAVEDLRLMALDLDTQCFILENQGVVPIHIEGWAVVNSSAFKEIEALVEEEEEDERLKSHKYPHHRHYDVSQLTSHKVFAFPDILLSPQSQVTVYCGLPIEKTPIGQVGPDKVEEDAFGRLWFERPNFELETSEYYFYWKHEQMWQDLGDTAYLIDPKGRCVDSYYEEG